MKRTTSHRFAICGFTLLEVMIALVIFSIGLLGLAGLQARGLQSNSAAHYRTVAAILAYDMADRLRSNPTGVSNGAYNALTVAPGAAPAPNCVTAACTPDEQAAYDYYEWTTQAANQLPSGHGTVTGAGAQFTIIVMWNEDRTANANQNCNELTCYQLVVEP